MSREYVEARIGHLRRRKPYEPRVPSIILPDFAPLAVASPDPVTVAAYRARYRLVTVTMLRRQRWHDAMQKAGVTFDVRHKVTGIVT